MRKMAEKRFRNFAFKNFKIIFDSMIWNMQERERGRQKDRQTGRQADRQKADR
jgi:hypothetical protein